MDVVLYDWSQVFFPTGREKAEKIYARIGISLTVCTFQG